MWQVAVVALFAVVDVSVSSTYVYLSAVLFFVLCLPYGPGVYESVVVVTLC